MGQMKSVQQSVVAGQKGYDLNEFKSGSTATEFLPCRQIRANADGDYKLYFAGRPDDGLALSMTAGEILDYALVKITNADGSVVDSGKILVVY
jgi:hypothetical protein